MTDVWRASRSAPRRRNVLHAAWFAGVVLAIVLGGSSARADGDSLAIVSTATAIPASAAVSEVPSTQQDPAAAQPLDPASAPDSEPAAAPGAATVAPPPAAGAQRANPAPGRPAAAESRPAAPTVPPADRSDLSAWLAYKAKSQQFALPREARVFYREGLAARDAGDPEHAIQLVRGAAELDPTYADPRFTLFTWLLPVSPGAAITEAANLVDLARENFILQLTFAANALYIAIQALFLGMLAVGMVLVFLHNGELRHRWQEWLGLKLSSFSAHAWPWALLILPYFLGVGLALPTLVLLAMAWPLLRLRERAFFVLWAAALCAAPWATEAMGRFAHPLEENQGPLYGVMALHNEPYSAERRERFERIATRDANNPYAQFGLAWEARQGGDYATSEQAYRRALALWPDNDRLLNDLGNVLTLEDRHDEAIKAYRRAVVINPANAAAYLNLSQQYTRHFEFRAAQDAISHAWALDFELLRRAQAQTTGEGLMPLVDQWPAPRTFWPALRAPGATSDGAAALPPLWRGRIEAKSAFTFIALFCVILGLVAGMAQERALPLRRCSNCDAVVCRRCAERRRATAYCRACASAESGAQAFEFSRMLLRRHRDRAQRTGRIARTAVAMIVPGFGLLAMRRVFSPLVILSLAAALLHIASGDGAPFAYVARFATPDRDLRLALSIPWAALYVWSIAGYLIALATAGTGRRLPVRLPTPRERTLEDGADRAAA